MKTVLPMLAHCEQVKKPLRKNLILNEKGVFRFIEPHEV